MTRWGGQSALVERQGVNGGVVAAAVDLKAEGGARLGKVAQGKAEGDRAGQQRGMRRAGNPAESTSPTRRRRTLP